MKYTNRMENRLNNNILKAALPTVFVRFSQKTVAKLITKMKF